MRFTLGICLLFLSFHAQAQVQHLGFFPYKEVRPNYNNVGIYVDMLGNLSEPTIYQTDGAVHENQGTISLVPGLGLYIRGAVSKRFTIRGGLGVGMSSFSFKYVNQYDSLRAKDTLPGLKKTNPTAGRMSRMGQNVMYVKPFIDLGYLFGPINKHYWIEARIGASLIAYMQSSSDEPFKTKGTIKDKKYGNFNYETVISSYYGKKEAWGFVVADFYLGVRWKDIEGRFFERSGIGIQVSYTAMDDYAGSWDAILYNKKWNNIIGRQSIKMTQYAIGIRYTYDFLPPAYRK